MDLYCRLPKVNLHHHLEGAVRPETFFHLVHRFGLPIPLADTSAAKEHLQVGDADTSLADFLVKVDRSLAVTQYPGVLQQVAFEAVEDSYRQNVYYLELRFGPWLHVQQRGSIEGAIEEVLAGMDEAMKKYPIQARLIVCALRQHGEKQNIELAATAGKYQKSGLVGFDLAGDEAAYPAQAFIQAFTRAREAGLGITVHAGEVGSGQGVVEAINDFGAQRIGHGIQIAGQPQMLQVVQKAGVTLEVCPTSNVHTKAVATYAKHPIRLLYQQGIPISLGDDDPTTSGITISDEYRLLATNFGFTKDDLVNVVLSGAKAAFLPEAEKNSLIQRLTVDLARWEEEE